MIGISGTTLSVNDTNVTARPTENTPQYTYDFDSFSVADQYEVKGLTTITAKFKEPVLNSYTVSGSLDVGQSGESKAGFTVALSADNPPTQAIASTSSNGDGEFSFENIDYGKQFYLVIQKPGYTTYIADTPVTVEGSTTLDIVTMNLRPVNVTGSVLSDIGEKAGFSVSLTSKYKADSYTTTTGSDGSFKLESVF